VGNSYSGKGAMLGNTQTSESSVIVPWDRPFMSERRIMINFGALVFWERSCAKETNERYRKTGRKRGTLSCLTCLTSSTKTSANKSSYVTCLSCLTCLTRLTCLTCLTCLTFLTLPTCLIGVKKTS
jgi:hypothetical protein